jgi:hypothetical protein
MVFAEITNAQTTTLSVQLGNPCQRITTFVDDTNNQNFLFYPNPTNGIINIEMDLKNYSTNTRLSVNDMIGRKVFETNVSKNSSVNLQSLTSGIYFIVLRLDNESITRKLVVNK